MADDDSAPSAPLRIREAVRGLVVDPDGRVLLVRFEFPNGTRWALPGGGLDPGESAHDGLRRELGEELGMTDPQIGAHIWNRLHIVTFVDRSFDGQREQILEVAAPAGFEPRPQFTWDQLHAEHLFEIRWWTADELAASDAVFAPKELPALFARYLAEGAPPEPFDVEV